MALVRRRRRRNAIGVLGLAVLLCIPSVRPAAASVPVHSVRVTAEVPLSVRVSGNRLVDGAGRAVRLLGVNRPGMDVLGPTGECVTTFGLPQNAGEIDTMASWRINAVRIPLNQDCWLGINGVGLDTSSAYRSALHRYVTAIHQRRLYTILDLHQSAPANFPSTAMQPMPDADHAPRFWSSVARSFRSDPATIFDLFNEPHLGDVLPEGSDYWACWLNGCTLRAVNTVEDGRLVSRPFVWRAAGMQSLVDAVRRTGARQPIMLSGLNYANGFTGWLTHVPRDPARQIVAAAHEYNESVGCVDLACWRTQLLPIARRFPIVTAELGEAGCAHSFMDTYMRFSDGAGISYLAWSWSVEKNCLTQAGASLITDVRGTPSASGAGFRAHLATLAR